MPSDSAVLPDVLYAERERLRGACSTGFVEQMSNAERREMDRYRNPVRREDWLLGRFLCRQLIRSRATGVSPDARIEILSRDDRGRSVRPMIAIDGKRKSWCLSLSHTERGVLAAISTRPGERVGVDLAPIEASTPGFLKTWFTPNEQEWLRSADAATIAAAWASKEAAYKACNDGEQFTPRRIEIRPAKPPQTGYRCRYDGVDLGTDCTIRICEYGREIAAIARLGSPGRRTLDGG